MDATAPFMFASNKFFWLGLETSKDRSWKMIFYKLEIDSTENIFKGSYGLCHQIQHNILKCLDLQYGQAKLTTPIFLEYSIKH